MSRRPRPNVLGLTDMEEEYGMALNAPHGFAGGRNVRQADKVGDVRYSAGSPVSDAQITAQRAIRARRAQGVTPGHAALVATRIGPQVVIVTARLATAGYRTVAVTIGGGVLELFADESINASRARKRHALIVSAAREHLESIGVVDVYCPITNLTPAKRRMWSAPISA